MTEMPDTCPDKYEVAKEFIAGFAAAVQVEPCSPDKSDHWHAGWDAGYRFRSATHSPLNEYLVSIGCEPMGIVRLA